MLELELVAVCSLLGCWGAVVVLAPRQLRRRMPKAWGVPRVGAADVLALVLMLQGPLWLAIQARNYYDAPYVLGVGCLLAASYAYLWFRGLWILQCLEIRSLGRRLLFLIVLLPALVLCGVATGAATIAILSSFGNRGGGVIEGMMLIAALLFGGVTRIGLDYVGVTDGGWIRPTTIERPSRTFAGDRKIEPY